jgi:hypothetical protein
LSLTHISCKTFIMKHVAKILNFLTYILWDNWDKMNGSKEEISFQWICNIYWNKQDMFQKNFCPHPLHNLLSFSHPSDLFISKHPELVFDGSVVV